MKKILFVINTMGRAGAETALLEMLRCLDGERIEISLYVLTGQGELLKDLPKDVRLMNRKLDMCSVHTKEGKTHLAGSVINAFFNRMTGFVLLPYLWKQLRKMMKQKRVMPDKLLWRVLAQGAERFEETFDLAVAYIEGGATYYVADFVKAKKKAAFVHVDYQKAGYDRDLDKDCYQNFDCIFAVSDEVREAFLAVYKECKEKTSVFENLINRERIEQMAVSATGFTDSFSGVRILTVGRLTAQKDFSKSVLAMKLLREHGRNVRWYILGEGEQRKALERLITELELSEYFYLPGTVENPYAYMKNADLYVHATAFEGKSVAIREAQILGCSVIVSNCSGNREQVKHKVDGLMCDFTPEAICEAIEQMLSDEALCTRCKENAKKRYSSNENEIQKLLSLLES